MIARSYWASVGPTLPLFIGLLLSLGAQAAHAVADGMKTIEGGVWYRERIALPPNAEIKVTLEDVARADAPSELIATTRLVPQGGPPYAFSLEYDPARLHDRGRYALRARIESDGRLLFISTEHIPAFEREPGPVLILVSRVGDGQAGASRPPPTPDARLTDTYWKLVEIGGLPVTLGTGERELHLVISGDGNRVHGFSGCNRFTGSYELSDDRLRLRQLASPRMACVEGMEQEQRFLDALANSVRFTISGDGLALHSGDERLILRFLAVYLQ